MSQAPGPDLSQRIAGFSYQVLRWSRDKLPPGVRNVLGLLFMVGGVFGFLPVLGFGCYHLALRLRWITVHPQAHRKVMETLQQKAARPELAHSIDDDLTDTNSATNSWPTGRFDDQIHPLTIPKRCMTAREGWLRLR